MKNILLKHIFFTSIFAASTYLAGHARADLVGSTYTMTSAYSVYVASANITILNVVPATYNVAALIVSNASSGPITVTWAVPSRAVGVGTTNQLTLSGGQLVEINVNDSIPGMVVYNTQLEQILPPVTATGNSLVPALLYYQLTEGAQAYQNNVGYFETPPVYLADSSTHGGTTGIVTATAVPIQWVPNQNGTPATAIHFNGASTKIVATNTTLFNFTTNLFSINVWVRSLTYPCAIMGNGLYLNYGWYLVVNPVGEIVLAAENPGSDQYVATTSTVAFNGTWTMVTVVRTGPSTVSIYANGLLQNTLGSFGNPAPSSNPVIFGDDFVGNQYDGDLGTIRIYDRPLSPSEVSALYQMDTAQ